MRTDREDLADSKRNVKPKGSAFATPVYADLDLKDECPPNDVGCVYFEYKSSSSGKSSSGQSGDGDAIMDTVAPFSGATEGNMIAESTVQNIRRRYNTTSTVHAAYTITSPDCEQILFWYVQFVSYMHIVM
jgi:hypothetical protein